MIDSVELSIGSGSLTALQDVLFDDQGLQRPWRALFSTAAFAFQEGLTHQQRVELAYQRLRFVNDAVADARALVCDTASLTSLHEWAGFPDAGMATLASIHYNLFLGSLLDHDQADRDLTPYLTMQRVGTFLCTEQEHGNDAARLETTATFDRESGGFILDSPSPGARKFMPNTSGTGGAKDAVVAARLIVDGDDKGVFLFLTPLTDKNGMHFPGVEVTTLPQMGTAPVDHCVTAFRNVALPFSALLQGEHGRLSRNGDFTSAVANKRKRFLRSINRVTEGKLCMSAYSLGVMRHALGIAIRYGHARWTSGMTTGQRVPLMSYRSHQTPLLKALATAYAATLLHRSVVKQWVSGEDRDDCERRIAIAKGWITWQARAVMTECRERCGAQGLPLANGIAFQLAANEGAVTAEGDNLVIWIKAAGESLLGGLVPAPASQTTPAGRSLLDSQHMQDLLADVERVWYERARKRLRTGRVRSPLDRWNVTVTPALQLINAHAHRMAAGALLSAATRTQSTSARVLLTNLHALFALQEIDRHSGDLLAQGRLTAEHVAELPDLMDAVVADLAAHSLELVEAFSIPEDVLGRLPLLQAGSADTRL